MTDTIVLGKARRLVLPKPLCERLHLREGDQLDVEIDGDSIRLRPLPDEGVKLVRKGGLLVATGFPKTADIVAAIGADRDERDGKLAALHRGPEKKKKK